MKKVFINRYIETARQTLGVLTVASDVLFVAKTLELPWINNASQISCIPVGEYVCRYTRSAKFSKLKGGDVYTYEIMNVPGRAGIRIHSANFNMQIEGCIALGGGIRDINNDGELDTINSVNAISEFEKVMDKKDFTLIIRSEI